MAPSRTIRIAAWTILVGVLVLALKTGAWWLTGSAALFSDALESTVNVAAACMAFAALWLAAKPADENHPYGHTKVEFFAAVGEGALILAAAALILEHAWIAWHHPALPAAPWEGIGLNAAASLINAAWAAVLLRAGRRARSPALAADGRHLLSDVVSSFGVVIGLALAWAIAQPKADPVLAALVAVYILFSGFRLLRSSVGGLMDEAPSPEIIERIRRVVRTHAEGALEAHDLRTRLAGQYTFVEFHLVVPGEMTVASAHAICDRIEAALREEMAGLVTTIHVEPDSKAKHHGVIVL